jgi:hypothetical protein
MLAGALLGGLLTLAAGYAIDGVGLLTRDPGPRHAYRAWLSNGGWVWPALYGAAGAAWLGARRMDPGRGRLLARVLAVLLALAPLAWRPFVPEGVEAPLPATAEGKVRWIRRASYRSPAEVAKLLPLSRDPDPAVRARATLALGVNLIVTDVEHDRPGFPSRHAAHPLRDSLRNRLLEALRDPEELVRAEAARALWKAPRTFGVQPAAAGTLAAILERRVARPEAGREAWLALDAAAGAPDSSLRAAARRFADHSPDTALARTARAALGPALPAVSVEAGASER